jgi:hypothetical protein
MEQVEIIWSGYDWLAMVRIQLAGGCHVLVFGHTGNSQQEAVQHHPDAQ